jgi:hypothetical protein
MSQDTLINMPNTDVFFFFFFFHPATLPPPRLPASSCRVNAIQHSSSINVSQLALSATTKTKINNKQEISRSLQPPANSESNEEKQYRYPNLQQQIAAIQCV